MQHLQHDPLSQVQGISGTDHVPGHFRLLEPGHAFAIGGIVVGAAIVQPATDLVAIQHLHQSRDVVGIGVGHDQEINAPIPEGHLPAQG